MPRLRGLNYCLNWPRRIAFPVRWLSVNDDAPGWEDAWDILDLSAVNDDEPASDSFFEDFNRYRGTKVGGYPAEIQHGVGLEDFVFQVGSKKKLTGCGRTTALLFSQITRRRLAVFMSVLLIN
jgi:hypothetical protein